MREADNLAALIDDADAWADQFCSTLPGIGPGADGATEVEPTAPIATRARSYRDLLYCRFADQAFSAARSARHGRPASTSGMIRSAFETFTRLFELRDHLDAAFAQNSLDALDVLLTARLFGGTGEDRDEEFTMGLARGLAEDEGEPTGDGGRYLLVPIADNDGPQGPRPVDAPQIDPGASEHDRSTDVALRRLMRTLIAIETSFDNSYRALESPMARLDEMFAAARHGR